MSKKTILLIDDESIILKAVKEIFKKEGYDVITASNGPGALKKLKRQKPDLALIDVIMPGMSGFDLTERIRADSNLKDLKIAFLTILNFSNEQKKNLKKLGVVDCIQKPFNPEDLVERVKKIIG
jgi:two-component system sensor histidine kinase/response regulator